ncbi:lysozyme [Aestuariivirga sp.]|uniref:lysozyme n=1 Tax=Aestuariivirga sp. TaxID=2650926 RepID=UPI0039E2C995
MKVNAAGLAIIKTYEGCEVNAYPDPATDGDPWTIGYGHTSEAGPPNVRKGMKISKARADEILTADIGTFSRSVMRYVGRELTDNQFSALVSFAFNVGTGNFAKSSVLKAVNRGDFKSVPWRIQLWTKANGRTLPGLVKRRAAESHLFESMEDAHTLFAAPPAQPTQAELLEMREARGLIGPDLGKPIAKTGTFWGGLAAGAAGIFGAMKDTLYQIGDLRAYLPFDDPTWLSITLAAIVGTAVVWIIHARMKRSREDGV